MQASCSTSKSSNDGFCQQAFKERAQDQFGSGWVWLAVDRSDYDVEPTDPEALVIIALPNQVAIQVMHADPWSGRQYCLHPFRGPSAEGLHDEWHP